jgi:DNA ligase 1
MQLISMTVVFYSKEKQMKPLLAATVKDVESLNYPLLASPKYDGVRALIKDGVVLSRSLKPIPNKYVQLVFGKPVFEGFDGELIVGSPTAKDVFSTTMSAVMASAGTPLIKFFVFDKFNDPDGFSMRFNRMYVNAKMVDERVSVVTQRTVHNAKELLAYEEELLRAGYEGVMLRAPMGEYKHGRSTLKEGILMKLKRFSDSEAEVLSYQELMHNTNEAMTNELGQKARSSKKVGMSGKGTLGALAVRDLRTGIEFDIGTGFDQKTRDYLWSKREELHGKIVKYKYFAGGVKEKPRFPVFLGFRDKIDM